MPSSSCLHIAHSSYVQSGSLQGKGSPMAVVVSSRQQRLRVSLQLVFKERVQRSRWYSSRQLSPSLQGKGSPMAVVVVSSRQLSAGECTATCGPDQTLSVPRPVDVNTTSALLTSLHGSRFFIQFHFAVNLVKLTDCVLCSVQIFYIRN